MAWQATTCSSVGGRDRLNGGSGTDRCVGGAAPNRVAAGTGADNIVACQAIDHVVSTEVTLIQRFGPAANLNIHLHCLVLDGVYRTTEGLPVFHEVQVFERDFVDS